jgi:hypothetical protein
MGFINAARFDSMDLTIQDAGPADHPRAARLLSLAYAEYLRLGDEEPGWIDYVSNEVPDISSRSEDTLIAAENRSGEMLACVSRTSLRAGRRSRSRACRWSGP